MEDVAIWAAAVSAIGAAVAAFLSWRTNVQARRAAEDARLASLHSQLSRVEGKELITIVNAGPGIAKGCFFWSSRGRSSVGPRAGPG